MLAMRRALMSDQRALLRVGHTIDWNTCGHDCCATPTCLDLRSPVSTTIAAAQRHEWPSSSRTVARDEEPEFVNRGVQISQCSFIRYSYLIIGDSRENVTSLPNSTVNR